MKLEKQVKMQQDVVKSMEEEKFNEENIRLQKENEQLKKQLSNSLVNQEYLQALLQDNAPLSMRKEPGNNNSALTTEAVECIMSILPHTSSGGAIPVLTRVLTRVIENLPTRTTVDDIRIRGLAVSYEQIGDLSEKTQTTLYTDETRRGDTYMVYAVTDKDQTPKVLGIPTLPSKSAADTLDTFIMLLKKISKTCEHEALGDTIISNLKNTQSDHAATEKLFNKLLLDYQEKLLPKVIEHYQTPSSSEQNDLKKMNHFFVVYT